MDKKIMVYGGLTLVMILVVFIVGAFLINIFMPKYFTYGEVEEKMVTSANMYYQNHKDFLPTTEGMSTTVKVEAMVNEELIKPLAELIKNGSECSGEVIVTYNLGEYTYIPYLTCPDYISIELHKVVNDPKNLVNEGKGLYYENSEYVFKGEVQNNYVMLNNKLWRILKTDVTNNMLLVQDENYKSYKWDDRYNTEERGNSGINNFNLSRMRDQLDTLFAGKEILSDSEKSKLVLTSWCVGQRKAEDKTKDNSTECKVYSEEKGYFGLLTAAEFIRPSLDPKCKSTLDKPCINYNFLTTKTSSTWTLTPSPKTSAYLFALNLNGLYEARADYTIGIKIAIYLSNRTMYKEGNGTISEPYIIR